MSEHAARIAALLAGEAIVTAPGIFDGLSARLAEASGAQALYLTGYGVSASLLGKPDAGFLDRPHMVDRIHAITSCTNLPLIADADTGFDDIAETVRGYEQAGAAAMQLEDQVFPKRCGHTPGRQVVALDEALDRIKVALDARNSSDFQIIARTDARTSLGLDAAIERGQAFHDAGADIVFIESPESEVELAEIAKALPQAKLLANMVEGGRTPFLKPSGLQELGFSLAIYPVMGLAAAAQGLQSAYRGLKDDAPATGERMSFADLNSAVGFEEIWAEDARKAAD